VTLLARGSALIRILAFALIVSACTAPTERTLRARSGDGAETLTGKVTSASDGGWAMSLTSDLGSACTGMLRPDGTRGLGGVDAGGLRGPIRCSDGRNGEVGVLFNGHRGAGAADIGDRTFLVTVGD
jgi:hypothetical protein